MLRVWFELLSQAADQNVDGAVERRKFAAARNIEKDVPRQCASGIFHERQQQIILRGGQRDVFAAGVTQVAPAGMNGEAFKRQDGVAAYLS